MISNKMGLLGQIGLSSALAFGLLVYPVYSDAAENLTLDQAILEAGGAPELKLSEGLKDEASGNQAESMSGFLPTVGLTGYHLTNVKYQSFSVTGLGPDPLAVPVVVPQTSFKLTATLPLFDGLRNVNAYRAASARSESANSAHDWKKFEVEQEVKRAYYRALAAKLLAEVANQNIATLEDHSSHVEARMKGGVATRYDTLRVEVQLDEAKSQKLLADDNVVLERRKLARIIGAPNDDRPLEGTLPEPKAGASLTSLSVDQALQQRADLSALRANEQGADFERDARHFWWVPSIGAFTDYEIYNNSNFDLTSSTYYHNAYDVGISLHWNLFDGGSSIAKARISTAKNQQAKASLDAEVQRLPESLEMWKRRYLYGVALYKTATSDIRKSEESVRQAQEGFKQGVRTVSEQLDAQLDLFRSRASQVNAQLTAAEALIELELTMGRKLNNDNLN